MQKREMEWWLGHLEVNVDYIGWVLFIETGELWGIKDGDD